MKLVYLTRSEWGSSVATETFIRDRRSDSAAGKDTLIVHHVGAIDVGDDTPNRWGLPAAIAYMRRLQTSRPDLGPLPYSFNLAVSEALDTVWVFQGRGATKRGAHTAQLNSRGVGLGVFGNFDKLDGQARAVVLEGVEQWSRMLKTALVPGELALPNLGNHKSPKGWEFWGHRDGPNVPKTCPGNTLYPYLEGLTFNPIPAPTPGRRKNMYPLIVDRNEFIMALTEMEVRAYIDNGVILPATSVDYWLALLAGRPGNITNIDWDNLIAAVYRAHFR